MKNFIKLYWKTLVFFAVVGIVGGFFAGLYALEGYPPELQQQLVDELAASGLGDFPVDIVIAVITAVQSAGYGLVLGAIGIFLAKKVGLWKGERNITPKPLLASVGVAIVGGLAMILLDIFYFANYSQAIADSYLTKPSVVFMLASITYGAVIEEVMMRLFVMSLVSFVLFKLFERKEEQPSNKMFVIANVVTAILFASGHLPATVLMIGTSPIVIARCFLLNGGIGLLFGWLYRKYGLRYAMIAHGGCHVVSKLIWILFI